MLKFFIYSNKALQKKPEQCQLDFLGLVTKIEGKRHLGWKCTFGPDGVRHAAVNAYKTPVPFDEVERRLGTDDVEGNKGSHPTLDFVPDSFYREVTIRELIVLGKSRAQHESKVSDEKIRNVSVQMTDDAFKRLTEIAKLNGYASLSSYLVAQALGEPQYIETARLIVFDRVKRLPPGTEFTTTSMLTPGEAVEAGTRSVGRAVSSMIALTSDAWIRENVIDLNRTPKTYKVRD